MSPKRQFDGAVSTKQICIPPGSPTKRDKFDFAKEIAQEARDARNASFSARGARENHRLTKRPVTGYCYNGCTATGTTRTP